MSFTPNEAKIFGQIVNGGPGPLLTSGPVLAMELRSRARGDATAEWHEMIPYLQKTYAGSFWGASKAVEERASRVIFDSPSSGLCANLQNYSACLIKPHCIAEGNLG